MNSEYAELTVFAVDCIYGQLISAVYSVLAYDGRRSLSDLVRILNLTSRQVKTTLVVLIQHHLVYHVTDENDQTYYTANEAQAYNVCFRIAKLIKWAEDRHGKAASTVLLKISALGHAKLEDLEIAFGFHHRVKSDTTVGKKRSFADAMEEEPPTISPNGHTNQKVTTNGNGLPISNKSIPTGEEIKIHSVSHLHHIVDQLLRDGFLMKVTEYQYLTDHEIAEEAELEINRLYYPVEGPKGSKEKAECRDKIRRLKAEWRDEATKISDVVNVKRKGRGGRGSALNRSIPLSENGFRLKGDYAFRISFEKASVILRNSQLVTLAHRYIGETTSKVYEAMLRLQEQKLARCWDTLDDIETRQSRENQFWFSSEEILEFIDVSINLKDGLSQASQSNGVNGHHSSFNPESSNVEDKEDLVNLQHHLDLLVNDSRHFINQQFDNYSVPFTRLSRTLLQNTIERHVTARFGPIAARIIRMLTQHGTQDEKFLAQTGILKPKEIRALTNILLKAGLIDTQEIPRDGNRTTNRILWLYAFNPKRARLQLLKESHQAMRNLLRRIEAERKTFAFVIRKSERTDVVGREDELLSQNDKLEMATFRSREERMIGMLERLDDFVACLGSEFLPIDVLGTRYRPFIGPGTD